MYLRNGTTVGNPHKRRRLLGQRRSPARKFSPIRKSVSGNVALKNVALLTAAALGGLGVSAAGKHAYRSSVAGGPSADAGNGLAYLNTFGGHGGNNAQATVSTGDVTTTDSWDRKMYNGVHDVAAAAQDDDDDDFQDAVEDVIEVGPRDAVSRATSSAVNAAAPSSPPKDPEAAAVGIHDMEESPPTKAERKASVKKDSTAEPQHESSSLKAADDVVADKEGERGRKSSIHVTKAPQPTKADRKASVKGGGTEVVADNEGGELKAADDVVAVNEGERKSSLKVTSPVVVEGEGISERRKSSVKAGKDQPERETVAIGQPSSGSLKQGSLRTSDAPPQRDESKPAPEARRFDLNAILGAATVVAGAAAQNLKPTAPRKSRSPTPRGIPTPPPYVPPPAAIGGDTTTISLLSEPLNLDGHDINLHGSDLAHALLAGLKIHLTTHQTPAHVCWDVSERQFVPANRRIVFGIGQPFGDGNYIIWVFDRQLNEGTLLVHDRRMTDDRVLASTFFKNRFGNVQRVAVETYGMESEVNQLCVTDLAAAIYVMMTVALNSVVVDDRLDLMGFRRTLQHVSRWPRVLFNKRTDQFKRALVLLSRGWSAAEIYPG